MCLYELYTLLLLFFFFKQKTAYEMRISDWSSDVCSSDLFFATLIIRTRAGGPETQHRRAFGICVGHEPPLPRRVEAAFALRPRAFSSPPRSRDRKSVV